MSYNMTIFCEIELGINPGLQQFTNYKHIWADGYV